MTTTAEVTAADRLLAAFTDPGHEFTRDQVAWIISMALGSDDPDMLWRAGYEAGYWARVADENAAYPPEPLNVTESESVAAVQVYRRRAGVDRRYHRRGDHPGGPVEIW